MVFPPRTAFPGTWLHKYVDAKDDCGEKKGTSKLEPTRSKLKVSGIRKDVRRKVDLSGVYPSIHSIHVMHPGALPTLNEGSPLQGVEPKVLRCNYVM